jgi:hypothetical protein
MKLLAAVLALWLATVALGGCINGFGENIDPFPTGERLD